jgi:hypothetical protein
MGTMKDEAINEHNQETISILPDEQGWATTAAMFVENTIGQVPTKQRDNASAMIATALSIAAHLGNEMAQGNKEAKDAYDWLYARFAKDAKK